MDAELAAMVGQLHAVLSETLQLQERLPRLTLQERRSAFQHLADLAAEQEQLVTGIHDQAGQLLDHFRQQQSAIARKISFVERLLGTKELQPDDLTFLLEWTQTDLAALPPQPTPDQATEREQAVATRPVISGAQDDMEAVILDEPPVVVPVSEAQAKWPEKQAGETNGSFLTKSASSHPAPQRNGGAATSVSPLVRPAPIPELKPPEYSAVRPLNLKLTDPPSHPFISKERTTTSKRAVRVSKTVERLEEGTEAPAPPTPVGAETLALDPSPVSDPVAPLSTTVVTNTAPPAPVTPEPPMTPEPPVTPEPAKALCGKTDSAEASEHAERVDSARSALLAGKCSTLLINGSKGALAKGWLLASWLEKSTAPYPASLPRPVEIEVGSLSLPRLRSGKQIYGSEGLVQSLVTATESASGGGYELSPCQAHIRLAIGLPLLLLGGLEPAFPWVVAGKDQSDSPALRHLASEALSYWQRTHTPLKDAIREVVDETKRDRLAQKIADHYHAAMITSFNYAPAAKVRNKLLPRHGDGGLRWILQAVQEGDIDRLSEWVSEFDADAEIDRYTRIVSNYRDKVDYAARSKLVEVLSTLEGYVRDWCAMVTPTAPLHSGGISAYGRTFRDAWRNHADEYEAARAGLPEDQAVARAWLQTTFSLFHTELGGGSRE